MIEIESKFLVSDMDRVELFLNEKATKLSNKVVDDIYFDSEDKILFKTGIFIRIRNKSKIDFKFNLDDLMKKGENSHTHCSEFSFPIPIPDDKLVAFNNLAELLNLNGISKPSFDEFLQSNGLIESVPVYKKRITYKFDNFVISVDDVSKLGSFLEIEHECPDGSTNEYINSIKEKINNLSNQLELSLIDTGYNALYWRKYDYATYKQSPYMMKKDKK